MEELFETARLSVYEIGEATSREVTETTCEGDAMLTFLKTNEEATVLAMQEDPDAALAYMRKLVQMLQSSDVKRFGGRTKDGKLVVYVAERLISTGKPELQVSVTKDSQNKGYATEMLKGLLEWQRSREHIDYYIYKVRLDNAASERVVQKLGGVPQPAENRFEELVSRTYYIYMGHNQRESCHFGKE